MLSFIYDYSHAVQLVVTDSPVGKLGVTICYDLRFPDVYQRLTFDMGAEVLLIPSAFTKPTGVTSCHLCSPGKVRGKPQSYSNLWLSMHKVPGHDRRIE